MSAKRSDRTKHAAEAYELEVALVGSKPRIWRRLCVGSDTTLQQLHGILQQAMGWQSSHLYRFEVGEQAFEEPDPDDPFPVDERPGDARRIALRDLGLRKGSELSYVYDLGDWWEHHIVVDAVNAAGEHPRCIAGARACPPEDSGGVEGYTQMLAALRNPRHREHAQVSEWLPRGFDPEAFDVEAVNVRLQRSLNLTRRSARRATPRSSRAVRSEATRHLKYVDELLDAGGEITLGRAGAIPCAAIACDPDRQYATLVRRDKESLEALLARLDAAICTAFEDEVFIDEING